MADVVCAVGAEPIAGKVWRVAVAAHPDKVPMCETHGRTLQYGLAMVEALGADHPTVVRLLRDLERILDAACPEREGYPLPDPGAGEHQDPYYVGALGVAGAGCQPVVA